MFSTSERSFGRSLLFLKDQLKDLKASDRELSRDVESIGQQISAVESALVTKRSERERTVNALSLIHISRRQRISGLSPRPVLNARDTACLRTREPPGATPETDRAAPF